MIELIKRYSKAYENLNESNIEKVLNCVSKDLIFIDPFNEIKGKDKFEKLFLEMFKKIKKPKFKILNLSDGKKLFYIKWAFSGVYIKSFIMEGVSEIHIKNNLITKHIDYWDSGKNFYCNIPMLGKVFKKIHKIAN